MKFQGPSPTARVAAAFAALGMVAAFLYLLRGSPLQAPHAAPSTVTVLVHATRPPPLPPLATPAATRPSLAHERTAPRPPSLFPSTSTDLPATAEALPAPLAITRPPDAPASAPLDLGAGSAIARSKGMTRQMAESSGQSLDTPRASAAQQLVGGIQDAGVESCLGPEATRHEHPALAMGGLLSLPGLVVAAVTGRCKP